MKYISESFFKLFEKSPVWSKNLYSTAYGYLKKRKEFNELYKKFLHNIQETEYSSLDRLNDIQHSNLKKIIKHASESIPYYQRIFAEYGIIPSQIQTKGDLSKLPVLSKEDIKENYTQLLFKDISPKLIRLEKSSGTTGKPFGVYMDNAVFDYTTALLSTQYRWAGYDKKIDWVGRLSGYKITPLSKNTPPFWTKNYIGKQLHLSSYHLNFDNIKYYFDILKKTKTKYISGYPSTVGLLAKFFKMKNYELSLKGVFLSSEPIYDWHKKVITDVFGCKIYNFYGQAERVITAISCGKSLDMHLSMESGIIELIKVTKNNYDIIGTSLINYAMPLIRYDLNDITSGFENDCSCGRKHILLKEVVTKNEDYVITPEGNLISGSILTFPFKSPKGIIESQIIQKDRYSLLVNLVTDNDYNTKIEEKLENDIKSCVGRNMKIFFTNLQSIPRTNSGKFRFVISEITSVRL